MENAPVELEDTRVGADHGITFSRTHLSQEILTVRPLVPRQKGAADADRAVFRLST